jgi:two-component system, cell cycle response regulator
VICVTPDPSFGLSVERHAGQGSREVNAPLDRRRTDATADSEPLRLLLVEDNACYRAYAVLLARRAGFAVEAVADAGAALGCTSMIRFDVVLIDQALPEITGTELITLLRADDETKGLYAVMLSGDDTTGNKLAALQAGFDDFIAKSLPEAEILAKLAAARRVALRQRSMDFAMRELYGMAARDELTGLFNRRFFVGEVERLLSEQAIVNVILFDLDGFKQINDTFGHLAGDRVLRDVAGVFQMSTRPEDIVARLGGDEFVMAVRDLEIDEIDQVAKRLAERIENCRWAGNDRPFSVGVSAGIASSRLLPEPTLAGLLDAADRDMYKNKYLRKNPQTRLLGALTPPPARPPTDEVRFVWPAPLSDPGVTADEPARPERTPPALGESATRIAQPPRTR